MPKRLVKDRLLSAHANNEKLISQERSRNLNNKQFGAGTSYQLGKKKEELESAMDQVDDNDEEGLFLGLLVMVWADSLEVPRCSRKRGECQDTGSASPAAVLTFSAPPAIGQPRGNKVPPLH